MMLEGNMRSIGRVSSNPLTAKSKYFNEFE
jgi:hypothetical protein